ncbi:DUF934 domain-containing protein [Thiobacillus sp.]|jgi:uncharacterized protein (DUF934 family)|uniref:DUF934 domain-containing protein n=1 Tax=Thiobacillus sp. TaxID=924 RepID=UPI0025EAD714|nr:DUF934 domain-containing protein [Thiobacillus sp.]
MSQIIKRGRIQSDEWKVLHLTENNDVATVVVPAGRVIVPLEVWQVQRPQLAGRAEAGMLGVWLTGDTDLAELAEDLVVLQLIAVDFPEFTNGRGYSIATQLRTRYGYVDELRAIGNVLRDQFIFMIRCGFSTLQPHEGRYNRAQIEAELARLSDSTASPGKADMLDRSQLPYYGRRLSDDPGKGNCRTLRVSAFSSTKSAALAVGPRQTNS